MQAAQQVASVLIRCVPVCPIGITGFCNLPDIRISGCIGGV